MMEKKTWEKFEGREMTFWGKIKKASLQNYSGDSSYPYIILLFK